MLRNGLEPWHLIVVALVLIMLFGSKKLPDAARGLGKSMRILKSEARALKADDAAATATAATATPADAKPAPAPEAHTHTS
ncbi:Sec-independent protein translocase subunit TatA [Streptomyces sp. SID13666]|uniref:Sec-independent protein translocase subunit TatA n=1 Tax=Streptomyces TaxID=1883 RepID=UPI001106BF67|nr:MULTISPECIES: Sec-independent protein translocase subunit TatA [Streptomyces]MCZ4102890.1 Sec-independent protein translocase subunit TatA [Streptomyces sp. H39-C1]NEA55728.1 Sec-independent protein translocase subunit TatA [Streptomyces sp. SID13666]NEA73187.1 Sec-independent protein translocase subunit TatA [Streptomyces sp. SID13588]QNA74042.1 Sec-independent protein translocase subunit TatA [Streptomyces sp. So13.3]